MNTEVKKARLLFIDDETEFLETLIKRMKKRGLDVNGIDTGDAAFAFLAENHADVIVLDFKMPGMDGIRTLEKIKAGWPLTEIIMLTGHACMEAAIKGMEAGAFDYLIKPVDIDELIFKIEDAYAQINIKKKMAKREAVAGSGDMKKCKSF